MIKDDPTIIQPTLNNLKNTWLKFKTRPLSFRKQQLQNMLKGIEELTPQFNEALNKDLKAQEFYSKFYSINPTKLEIEHTLHNFEKWAKIRSVDTSMLVGPAKSYVQLEPLGVALVISAWNYPLVTALPPAAQAIAAGNCVVLKPSELAPHSSNVMRLLFEKYLDSECYKVIEGGAQVASQITTHPFDLVIFTGSPEKGKLVARAAADNLIPCILELGGKSPVIVDSDSNINNAALRIAQGRYTNAGQTCIASDYALVHKSVEKQFKQQLIQTVKEFYGKNPLQSDDYIRIVNQNHTERIASMITENHNGKVIHGGNFDIEQRYIEPTIIENPDVNSRLMQEEIFGPILPIITFEKIEEAVQFINKRPKPLALYYFGYKNNNYVQSHTSSGQYAQNDCIFHMINSDLPFGGVQNSGLGAYHGIYGFDSCSHKKAIFHKQPLNIYPYSARYPPYTKGKQRTLNVLFSYLNFSQSKFFKSLAFIASFGLGFKFYSLGKFDPFINNMKPYIKQVWKKQSKL